MNGSKTPHHENSENGVDSLENFRPKTKKVKKYNNTATKSSIKEPLEADVNQLNSIIMFQTNLQERKDDGYYSNLVFILSAINNFVFICEGKSPIFGLKNFSN